MNRIIALLLPIAALTSAAQLATPVQSNAPATYWADSVTAEANQNYAEAITKIQAFQKSGGDPFMSSLRAAWLSYSNKDYTNAALEYSAAIRLQPSALNAHLGLLSTAQALNDYSKISVAAENVLRIEPSNYTAHMALAGAYYNAGDQRRAFSAYRRVLNYYPDDLAAASGAAWSALNIGDKTTAAVGFKRILSMSPDYSMAQRGYELSLEAKPKQAMNGTRPMHP